MRSLFLFSFLVLHSCCLYAQSTFMELLERLPSLPDSATRSLTIDEFLRTRSVPIKEDSIVHFMYRGPADSVSAPGEMNRWDPASGTMIGVDGTNLFYFTDTLPIEGRVEYKLKVDGDWILDPLNPRRAMGGYGENSDLWMPRYVPPTEIRYNPDIPHGTIDSLQLRSKILKRTHPIFVYSPAGADKHIRYPTLYVTDGYDYLQFGKMANVLDNLIAAGRIRPVIAIFIDPRTNVHDNQTNQRMTDYAASDTYLRFLQEEAVPFIEEEYRVSEAAVDRAIMGASMGGVISTYAVLQRPEVFPKCAAQSPAYWQADSVIIAMAGTVVAGGISLYIDTGTLHDTIVEARLVAGKLLAAGAWLSYAEYPEGHNWWNWRARLDEILIFLFPAN